MAEMGQLIPAWSYFFQWAFLVKVVNPGRPAPMVQYSFFLAMQETSWQYMEVSLRGGGDTLPWPR